MTTDTSGHEMALAQAEGMMDQEARDTLRKAAEVVGDMRFMQAASITALRLNGKAYAAAKTYMNELADLQKKLQDMALGETK